MTDQQTERTSQTMKWECKDCGGPISKQHKDGEYCPHCNERLTTLNRGDFSE